MSNNEQLLISAVLNTKDHINPAARGITKKFFYSYPDEWAFIERYIKQHKRTPSKVAFATRFPEFRLKKSADDVEHFCDEVKNGHKVASVTSTIQDALADLQTGNVDKALEVLNRETMQIQSQLGGISGDEDVIENYQDVVDEVMRRVARNKEYGQAGLPTGFPTLDDRTGGPQPGHVWIWAARLGQGKTWSLVRTAAAACFSGFNVQYDALESSRPEIAMRFHTFASSEYGKEVFKNLDLSMGRNFSPRSYKEFLHELRDHVKGRMHIGDTSNGPVNPMTIASQIERNKPDAVFLDYITLLDGTDSSSDDWKSIGKTSKLLKQIAERYGIPIVAAAQLNRNAALGKGPAGPEALAESDAIGRDADAVITMKQLSKHIIQMKLVKYRHGRDGYSWYCKFLPNTGHFEEVTFDEAQDIIADDQDETEEEENRIFTPRKKGSYSEASSKRHTGKPVVVRKSGSSSKKIIVPKKKKIVVSNKKVDK